MKREDYVREHGSERFLRLLRKKLLGRLQRGAPLAGLRRRFARWLGVRVDGTPWIGVEVYLDDTFPELITIGSGSVLGIRATILCHDDATRRVAPVVIGRNCYVGACAILLPGVEIGEGAVIGAGSVVTKSVPAGQTWAGVPARRLARRERIQCTDNDATWPPAPRASASSGSHPRASALVAQSGCTR